MSSEEKHAIERMTSPEAFARWLALHTPVPLQPAEGATDVGLGAIHVTSPVIEIPVGMLRRRRRA